MPMGACCEKCYFMSMGTCFREGRKLEGETEVDSTVINYIFDKLEAKIKHDLRSYKEEILKSKKEIIIE
jgi:hypothetical protein